MAYVIYICKIKGNVIWVSHFPLLHFYFNNASFTENNALILSKWYVVILDNKFITPKEKFCKYTFPAAFTILIAEIFIY